jgi:hypothetical protein
MDTIVYTKRRYNPTTPSVAIPIIGHSHEVIIPVNVAREFYPYLTSSRPLPTKLRLKLKSLFESSPTVI